MDRRAFLQTSAAAAATAALPWRDAPASAEWRTFETVTRVEVLKPRGVSRAWVPLPMVDDTDWHKAIGNSWTGNAARAQVASDGKYGATMVYAEWRDGEPAPVLEVTSRFMTRERGVSPRAR
jgi:FtsP/CotA-like multicopper oxidase with cupredoxin domain